MTEKSIEEIEAEIEETRRERPDIMQFYFDVRDMGPEAIKTATEILNRKKSD